VVPGSLHRRAEETIGAEGIVDVTVLMGWFTGVSLTLAAFGVPSNAVGLKQQPVGFGQFTQLPAALERSPAALGGAVHLKEKRP
jgi:hypothetical protein